MKLTHENIAEAFNRIPDKPQLWGYEYRIQDVPSQTPNTIGTIRYLRVYFVNQAGEKISDAVKSSTYYFFRKPTHPKRHISQSQAKQEAYDKLSDFMTSIGHFEGPELPYIKTLEDRNNV